MNLRLSILETPSNSANCSKWHAGWNTKNFFKDALLNQTELSTKQLAKTLKKLSVQVIKTEGSRLKDTKEVWW